MCKMHRCTTGTRDSTSDSPSAPPDTFVPGSPTGKTNETANQPQASISSTETARLSYDLPFKGPVIECMGLLCVLPWGICLSLSLPQQPLTPGKQFSGRSSLTLLSAAPSTAFTNKASAHGAKEHLNEGNRATAGGWTLSLQNPEAIPRREVLTSLFPAFAGDISWCVKMANVSLKENGIEMKGSGCGRQAP